MTINQLNKNTCSSKDKSCRHLPLFLFSMAIASGASNINSAALAGEFSITEQSIKNLGNAAGGAAFAEDASTIFYNI